MGDNRYHKQEKLYEVQVDQTAKNIAAQFGYRSVPWLGLTYFCLVIQMLLAMLTQIQRKDFVTMTVCTLGFFFLSFPENVRRYQFRMLVALIFISIGQDVLWFIVNRDVDMCGQWRTVSRISWRRNGEGHIVQVDDHRSCIACIAIGVHQLLGGIDPTTRLQKVDNRLTRRDHTRHQTALDGHVCQYTELINVPLIESVATKFNDAGVRGRCTPMFFTEVGVADEVQNQVFG